MVHERKRVCFISHRTAVLQRWPGKFLYPAESAMHLIPNSFAHNRFFCMIRVAWHLVNAMQYYSVIPSMFYVYGKYGLFGEETL